jgi:hypothetical protein
MIDVHKTFPSKTIFAGGIWSWKGVSADYGTTISTTIPALKQCIEKGVKEVFATAWGDNGAETSVLSIMYGLQVYAEFGYTGKYDEAHTKARFAECTGENADAFLEMTDYNLHINKEGNCTGNGFIAKTLIYEDPLLLIFEKDFDGFDLVKTFEGKAEKFAKYAEESASLSDLMKYYSALGDFLYKKALWRITAPKAVREKNPETIALAVAYAKDMCKSGAKLMDAWKNLWYGRNKPFGFEIIDIRLGGMLARCTTASQRITAFAKGKIKDIPELSEEKLNCFKNQQGDICYKTAYHSLIIPCEL